MGWLCEEKEEWGITAGVLAARPECAIDTGGPGLEAESGKVKSGPQFWAWNICWRKKESPG